MALIVEDSVTDAESMAGVLREGGFVVGYQCVDTAEAMRTALEASPWDVVLCDYDLPQFQGDAALALYKELRLDVAFIVVSEHMGEEHLAEVFKAGAHDCVLKRNLRRLVPAVSEALRTLLQRRIERATNLRATYLASLVESCNDPIIGKTMDGTIVSWNKGAERLYGYEAGEVVGKSISVLFPPNRPDELPDILDRLKSGATVMPYETVRLRKDGTRVDVAVTVSPITDPSGRVIGASSVARDITHCKDEEDERVRLIYELTQALKRTQEQANPSSAVRGGTSRICRDLRLSDGRFLHYILQGIFNDATLLGQVQAQPLQQLGHHPFRPGYHAQAYLALSLGAFDG